jgi:hypothetical protein
MVLEEVRSEEREEESGFEEADEAEEFPASEVENDEENRLAAGMLASAQAPKRRAAATRMRE